MGASRVTPFFLLSRMRGWQCCPNVTGFSEYTALLGQAGYATNEVAVRSLLVVARGVLMYVGVGCPGRER